MPEPKPQTIKIDKEQKSEILSALSDLKSALKEKESEKPKTVADKMAARLAEDPKRGIFSALSGALQERGAEKEAAFKKAIDPVNIVRRVTGGSKLASVLTAKALGRSPEEIRAAAGLSPRTEMQPDATTPEQLTLPYGSEGRAEDLPSPMGGVGGLQTITNILSAMAIRVDQIAGAMGAKPKFEKASQRYKVAGRFVATAPSRAAELGIQQAQEQLLGEKKDPSKNPFDIIAKNTTRTAEAVEQILDTDKDQLKLFERKEKAEDVASGQAQEDELERQRKQASLLRQTQKPERVKKEEEEEESGGLMGLIGDVVQTALAYKAIKGVLGGGKRGRRIRQLMGKKFLGKLGLGKVGKLAKVGAGAAAATGAVVAGSSIAKMGAEKTAQEVLEKEAGKGVAKVIGTEAAEKGGQASAKQATKESFKKKIKSVVARRIPRAMVSALGKSIPYLGAAIGLGFAVERLVRGDVVGAGLEATSGIGSAVTAVPATVALVAKDTYEEVYGVKPESDPLAEERLAEITDETRKAATEFIYGKAEESTPPAAPETASVAGTPEPMSTVEPSAKGAVIVPEPLSELIPPATPGPSGELNVDEWVQDVQRRQQSLGLKTIQPGEFEPIRRIEGKTLDEVSKDTARSKEDSGKGVGVVSPITNTVVQNSQPTTVVLPTPDVRSTDISFRQASGWM